MQLVAALVLAASLAFAQKAPFTVDALLRVARISEPQLSPDGKTVAFTVERPNLEANTRPKQIFTVPVSGGNPVQITQDGVNQRPRWTPDGTRIVFVSNRTGTNQIWGMNPDGSAPVQLTTFATGAGGVIVSPTGKHIVFTSAVYPECQGNEACSSAKVEADRKGVKPRTYTTLLYRHWNEWAGPTRTHLFVAPITGGPAKDLTPGSSDVPPFSLGGPDDYAISPDGSEVAYVANTDAVPAASTNADIFVVPVTGGESKRLEVGPGADRSPAYSPDGKYIAFRSQSRPGYESDKWRLMLYERATGTVTHLNDTEDRNVDEIRWSGDSTRMFYVVEDRGRSALYTMPAGGGASRAVITGNSHIGDVEFTPDRNYMIYTAHSGSRPVEIFKASASGGQPVPLTRINDELFAQYSLAPFEEFWVESPSDKAKIHSFLLKPPDFQAGRRYPLLVLIHGGPQGAWGESWSYRWNPQVFAAAGYVVILPNPRGSTGYGQKFTDEINQDWGGKPYEDLMAAVDRAAALPYVDKGRIAAAGGSYGGYMVNWILGHTDRFRALVSHAGVFDLRSMAGETEELWFPLWEFHGMPWDNPEVYDKYSPSHYVSEFKTPTLVIHGELDYRVPVGQGLQLFTALQMQKVPSKLVLFPDEGHWILKPQNSKFWYNTFLEWIGEWTKPRRARQSQ
jgi:dipeptidyl aminopeptidase/acylaminoacyl peptidase